MMYHLVSEEAFVKLSILQEKTGVALRCIIGGAACAHIQTLADIASDYLSAMDKMIQTMQESKITAPT